MVQREELPSLLCRCLSGRVRLVEDDTRYRLDDGCKHTRFMLFVCKDCGKLLGFPKENLLMFLSEGPVQDVEQLIEKYCHASVG